MKLKRKLKARVFVINLSDPNNPKGMVQEEFEDVLVESFTKRLLKSTMLWFLVFGILIEVAGIILTDGKYWAVLYTIIIVFLVLNLIDLVKTIKKESEE